MFWLFRRFCTLLGFLVLCAALLFFSRNVLTKWTLQWLVQRSTSFTLHVEAVDVPPAWPLKIELKNARIDNPPDFTESLALSIPRLRIEFDPSIWQSSHVNIKFVEMELSRINLVGTTMENSNLRRFTTIASSSGKETGWVEVELLQFKITDLRYAHLRRCFHIDSMARFSEEFSQIFGRPRQ